MAVVLVNIYYIMRYGCHLNLIVTIKCLLLKTRGWIYNCLKTFTKAGRIQKHKSRIWILMGTGTSLHE